MRFSSIFYSARTILLSTICWCLVSFFSRSEASSFSSKLICSFSYASRWLALNSNSCRIISLIFLVSLFWLCSTFCLRSFISLMKLSLSCHIACSCFCSISIFCVYKAASRCNTLSSAFFLASFWTCTCLTFSSRILEYSSSILVATLFSVVASCCLVFWILSFAMASLSWISSERASIWRSLALSLPA